MKICHRAPQVAQLISPLSSIRTERGTCQTSGNDRRSASTMLINLDAQASRCIDCRTGYPMLDSPSSRGASGPLCRAPGIPQRGNVDLRCLVNPPALFGQSTAAVAPPVTRI